MGSSFVLLGSCDTSVDPVPFGSSSLRVVAVVSPSGSLEIEASVADTVVDRSSEESVDSSPAVGRTESSEDITSEELLEASVSVVVRVVSDSSVVLGKSLFIVSVAVPGPVADCCGVGVSRSLEDEVLERPTVSSSVVGASSMVVEDDASVSMLVSSKLVIVSSDAVERVVRLVDSALVVEISSSSVLLHVSASLSVLSVDGAVSLLMLVEV